MRVAIFSDKEGDLEKNLADALGEKGHEAELFLDEAAIFEAEPRIDVVLVNFNETNVSAGTVSIQMCMRKQKPVYVVHGVEAENVPRDFSRLRLEFGHYSDYDRLFAYLKAIEEEK